MYIKVRVKHLLIPLIVFLITFFVLIGQVKLLVSNPRLDVSLVYSGSDLVNESQQKQIWESLQSIQEEYLKNEDIKSFDNMSLQFFNNSKLSLDRFKEITRTSEIIVIYGNNYNEILEKVVEDSFNTKFVLIDNTMNIENKNVTNIVDDHTKIIAESAFDLTKISFTNQYLFLASNDEIRTKERYVVFRDKILESKPEAQVKFMPIKDVLNTANVVNVLTDSYAKGYDAVYVDDMQLNKAVIEASGNFESLLFKQKQNTKIDDTKIEVDDNPASQNDTNQTSDNGSKIDVSYKQPKINVILNTFAKYINGVVIDSNEDNVLDIKDNSFIFKIYDNNIDLILKDIIFTYSRDDILLNDVFVEYKLRDIK